MFHISQTVAIDPGYSSGGIVHISGSTLNVAAYKKMNRKAGPVWRLTVDLHNKPVAITEHVSIWQMMDHAWATLKPLEYVLVVEQPFIPRGRLAGLTRLIESAGGWCATFAPGAQVVCRPTANNWRKAILNINSRVPAAQAERMCIDWANSYEMRSMCANGHACEALAMAIYAKSLLG